jgi:hypothetical protein
MGASGNDMGSQERDSEIRGTGYLRSVAVAVRFGSPAPRWAV